LNEHCTNFCSQAFAGDWFLYKREAGIETAVMNAIATRTSQSPEPLVEVSTIVRRCTVRVKKCRQLSYTIVP
jgi:hypothetical protein